MNFEKYNYSKFSDAYNILSDYPGRGTENGILWSAEFLLMYGILYDEYPRQFWFKMLLPLWKHNVKEMYTQTPDDSFPDEYISHDNLTAISSMSVFYNNFLSAQSIWNHLKTHWFTYDDKTGKTNFKRLHRPRDVIFYGANADNILCKFLLFWTMLCNIETCLKDKRETSGKLLAFMRNKATRREHFFMRISDWVCDKIINWKYENGWSDVFSIYFTHAEHPNRLLARELYADKNK